jgi:hypothetical protein
LPSPRPSLSVARRLLTLLKVALERGLRRSLGVGDSQQSSWGNDWVKLGLVWYLAILDGLYRISTACLRCKYSLLYTLTMITLYKFDLHDLVILCIKWTLNDYQFCAFLDWSDTFVS